MSLQEITSGAIRGDEISAWITAGLDGCVTVMVVMRDEAAVTACVTAG